MKKKGNISGDSRVFWGMSKDFISHRLPEIRKSSTNTVKAYRDSLNKFIDYLESEKNCAGPIFHLRTSAKKT